MYGENVESTALTRPIDAGNDAPLGSLYQLPLRAERRELHAERESRVSACYTVHVSVRIDHRRRDGSSMDPYSSK